MRFYDGNGRVDDRDFPHVNFAALDPGTGEKDFRFTVKVGDWKAAEWVKRR